MKINIAILMKTLFNYYRNYEYFYYEGFELIIKINVDTFIDLLVTCERLVKL